MLRGAKAPTKDELLIRNVFMGKKNFPPMKKMGTGEI